MALAGLDVGTSGVKCGVFTEGGRQIGFSKIEYAVLAEAGRYELNAEMVWNKARLILQKAAREAGEPIDGLAISALGEAGVPLDDGNRPLANAILFNDERGKEESLLLAERLGRERIFGITGVVSNGTYSIEKLMWIRRHAPYYKKIHKFLLFEDYLIYQLTGSAVISHSLAARTMALEVVNKRWSKEIFSAAGVDSSLMSTTRPSGTVVGQIRPALAAELGIHPSMRVVTGGHDGWCCAAGAGLLDSSVSVNVSGTCETLSFLMESPRREPFMYQGNYNCTPYVLGDGYGTSALGLTSGSLVRWFRDCFYKGSPLLDRNFYQAMDADVPPRPSGILVVPSFSVSGTPDFSLDAKGLIEGLTLTTSQHDIYKALMEGTAYHMRLNRELLQKHGICANTVKTVGGASVSPVWMQIKADILGLDIETVQGNETGVIGCAMLAGLALKKYRSPREAVAVFVKKGAVYSPNSQYQESYNQLYRRYQQLLEYNKDLNPKE